MSWSDCSSYKESGKTMVDKLKSKACTEFVKIKGCSNKGIDGADSVRLSNVRDHAQKNQHLLNRRA